jgi:hypothetical protein
MAMKINPPVYSKEGKPYERYKIELLAWREITSLPVEKQGVAIALSLPDDDPSKIREKVFDELTLDELKGEHGLEHLIEFLDKNLQEDDLLDSCEKYEHFEDYKRAANHNINEYINEFDLRYHKILKKNMVLPQEILAFRLLKCANITKEERLLVMTGMDYNNKATIYTQAKQSLKKFIANDSEAHKNGGSNGTKLEEAFLAQKEVQQEEAFMTGNYRGSHRGGWRGGRGSYNGNQSNQRGENHSQNSSWQGNSNFRGHGNNQGNGDKRPLNPKGTDGQALTCKSCGSYRHMMRECPDSWENQSKVNIVDDSTQNQTEEHVVLFTSNKRDIMNLCVEASKSAVLDSACSKTMC